jgi:tRNA 2-thiouridine synthesizing protein C
LDEKGESKLMVNKILLAIKSSPYGSGRAAEGLRVATAMIAMDLLPQILFIDDGVYCLLRNQKPESVNLTSIEERLKTLVDLIGIYAVSDSMVERKLTSDDLDSNYNVKTLSLDEVAKLISENEVSITF